MQLLNSKSYISLQKRHWLRQEVEPFGSDLVKTKVGVSSGGALTDFKVIRLAQATLHLISEADAITYSTAGQGQVQSPQHVNAGVQLYLRTLECHCYVQHSKRLESAERMQQTHNTIFTDQICGEEEE